MTRHTIQGIDGQGGLQAFMLSKGLDWELFIKMDDRGLNDSALGQAMGTNPKTGKPWTGNTAKRWRERRQKELSNGS